MAHHILVAQWQRHSFKVAVSGGSNPLKGTNFNIKGTNKLSVLTG